MTHTSGNQSIATTLPARSPSSEVSVPEGTPDWGIALFQKLNRIESASDDLHEAVGRTMGHAMQANQTINVVKDLAEFTAARLQALSRDYKIDQDDIAKMRKQMREFREARKINPDRLSLPGDMSTDQRAAIDEEAARRIAEEADEKREQKRELERLRLENIEQAGRLKAIEVATQAEVAKSAEERAESRKYWGRQIIQWLAIIVTGSVVAYVGYRLTKPANSMTIEQTAPIGAPSK